MVHITFPKWALRAAHALVHGELFDDPEVERATLEAEKLARQLDNAHPRLDAYSLTAVW